MIKIVQQQVEMMVVPEIWEFREAALNLELSRRGTGSLAMQSIPAGRHNQVLNNLGVNPAGEWSDGRKAPQESSRADKDTLHVVTDMRLTVSGPWIFRQEGAVLSSRIHAHLT